MRLFHSVDVPSPFLDEFSSIADGTKAMSVFAAEADGESSVRGSRWYRAIVRKASKLGLQLEETISPRESGVDVTLFVFRREEAWRRRAFLLLRECHEGRYWSDAAECMMSELLGYPADSTKRVIANHALCYAGWGIRTFYLLIPIDRFHEVARASRRLLPPGLGEEASLFAMSHPWAPRSPWPSRTMGLARFGARHAALAHLRRDNLMKQLTYRNNLLWSISPIARAVPLVEQYLKTDLQLWQDGEWV